MKHKIDWKLFNLAMATIPSLTKGEEAKLEPGIIVCINDALRTIRTEANAIRTAFDNVRGK